MTDIINMTHQNNQVNSSNESSKNRDTSSSDSEFNFLSIMQSEMNRVNSNQPNESETKEIKTDTKKESLALVAKNKIESELKKIENLNELKSAKNVQELIKTANEKGLKLQKLNLEKVDSEKLTELKKFKNLTNLEKLNEKELTLENEKLSALEKLKNEKTVKEKDALIDSLLKDGVKQQNKDNSKEVFSNAFNLESLLQKDENKVGQKIKRDKFVIETLKQDKLEGVDVKKEISLDLRLDGNAKSLAEVEVKNKMVEAKSTINSFASTLKEQVENYKPPIMKLSLSLNPKELGNVDVTLLSRGNSLHINLASNNQAMQLFAQNATEFKNALANIGFENVEMSFNSNGQESGQNSQNSQDGQSQRGFKYYSDNNLNFSVEELESLNSINLIIPEYA